MAGGSRPSLLLTLLALAMGLAPVGYPDRPEVAQAGPGAVPAASTLQGVFFDHDKDRIREGHLAGLHGGVGWLKANSRGRLTIAGHGNERGTGQCNLGLGERRAKAMKDSLVTPASPPTGSPPSAAAGSALRPGV